MGTKAESEHNLYRFLKVFTICYQKQDDINFFLKFQKHFKFTEQLQEQYRKLTYSFI